MLDLPTKQEISGRIKRLYDSVNAQGKEWDAVFLFGKINQYYFTGTMQDGAFVLKNDGTHAYFVRRSHDRAEHECLCGNLYPMTSYRDMHAVTGSDIHRIYIDSESVTHGILERFKRHFDITALFPADRLIAKLRAVKSDYELACMRESGRQHDILLETVVPELLREGMSEAELVAEMYPRMIKLGYQGVSRFAMYQIEMIAGQFGFGDNAIYPTCFDSPGGMKGMSAAVPFVGDRNRFLKKGDLVFVDVGYGYNGYHTDKTQIYMFGASPTDELLAMHRECARILRQAALLLKPGNIPAKIYEEVISGIDPKFLSNFMGREGRTAKFLGHGVGLHVDEYPVIAGGFNEQLEESMTIALEPKKSLEGLGIVGVEETYVVTPEGGECITGGERDIIRV